MSELHSNALYRWEHGLTSSWENVEEDAQGNLKTKSKNDEDRERSQKAKQQRITQSVRRGIIRYTLLGIDCSQSALDNDYRPSRMEVCKQSVKAFVHEYFDQNPISQLGLILTRERIAEEFTSLSSNAKHHLNKLDTLMTCKGLASLQNLLLLAIAKLRYTPTYVHREVVILYNSLSTCDPSDIFATIQECKKFHIHVHVISLVADIYICRKITEDTQGQYAVALNVVHLKELLLQFVVPPPELAQLSSSQSLVTDFIYMGFPKRSFDLYPFFSFEGKAINTQTDAYICPRCNARHSDIPTMCTCCGLQLYSSSHIARSFHHLFPVPNFIEYTVKLDVEDKQYKAYLVDDDNDGDGADHEGGKTNGKKRKAAEVVEIDSKTGRETVVLDGQSSSSRPATVKHEKCICLDTDQLYCKGCLSSTAKEDKLVFMCPSCQYFFCVECDLFIHDSLHNCPGC